MAQDLSRQFASMKFQEYEFREFPKHLTLPSGKLVVVNDKREELAEISADRELLAGPQEEGQTAMGALNEAFELERKRVAELEAEIAALRAGRVAEIAGSTTEAQLPHPSADPRRDLKDIGASDTLTKDLGPKAPRTLTAQDFGADPDVRPAKVK